MKKSLISILSLCVIIACGGINTDEDEPSVDNNECRKMPEMSCTHSPDDLTLNVHFTVKEDDSVTVIANFAHSSIDDIVASGSDKLELHVDHMIYKPTIGWTYGRHDFGVLPYNPRIYEIYWWRNDTVVAQGIIDRLPRLISRVSAYSDEVTDSLTIAWPNDSDLAFNIDLSLLTCESDSGMLEFFSANEHYKGVTSPFAISVGDVYGKSISDLKASYTECVVRFTTLTKDTTIVPVNRMDEKILFHPVAQQVHEATLF